ncbi:16S rRNA (guanine(966)-N(2))-methyltransferase RsmD [Micrococcales bacterium 31B]|nr:16S rRNA (guanine(966)-N(2))-methyltransferase RsmD [Micrococcales bacterium 31B]
MTRIIAGRSGGQRLKTPKTELTRPTSDRVREAIFSRLAGWDVLHGASVLDLYAGSGALGLEALSRGAFNATFVESHGSTAQVIRANAKALGMSLEANVVTARAETFVSGAGAKPFSLVLIDPPYDVPTATVETLIAGVLERHAADDVTFVVERSSRTPALTWPPSVRDQGSKAYGETTVYYGARF